MGRIESCCRWEAVPWEQGVAEIEAYQARPDLHLGYLLLKVSALVAGMAEVRETAMGRLETVTARILMYSMGKDQGTLSVGCRPARLVLVLLLVVRQYKGGPERHAVQQTRSTARLAWQI
jgi:hypothetical protein